MTSKTIPRRLGLATVSALLAVLVSPVPAQQEPWFGLRLPAGLSTYHEPTIIIDDDAAPLRAAVPPGEERWTQLAGERVRRYLEQIVGFSIQSRVSGDSLWGRVAGTPAFHDTVEWTAEEFEKAGVEGVTVDEFTVTQPLWIPTSWTMKLLGDGDPDIVLESAFPQRPSRAIDGTLTATLIFVGTGSSAEIANLDLEGKIAVVHKKPDPSLYHSRINTSELIARGAIAMVHVIELPGNMHSFDAGGCASTVPCFHLGGNDGAFLEAAIGAAAGADRQPLQMELSLEVELRDNAIAANAVAVVPGNGASDENIIVNAHADGWFDGASDNADGLAVLIALVHHFADIGAGLDRDLVFVASAGHHTSGGNGPAAFVAAHPEITRNTVLVLNIKHVAQLNMSTSLTRPQTGYRDLMAGMVEFPKAAGVSNQAPFLVGLFGEAAARYGVNIFQRVGPAVPGDLGGYRSLGVPLAQFIYASPVYHTSGDVLDTISTPGLERAARFHAFVITQAANTSRRLLQPDE